MHIKRCFTLIFFFIICRTGSFCETWRQRSSDDFAEGSFSNIVIENDALSIKSGVVKTISEKFSDPRELASAVYYPPDGKVYLFGGHYNDSGTGYYYSDILEYNPATAVFQKKSESLPEAVFSCTAVYNPLNEKIYLFGGQSGSFTSDIIEYDPTTDRVLNLSCELPEPRSNAACIFNSSDGKIYIIGGINENGFLDSILVFDHESKKITAFTESLPSARCGMSAAYDRINNRIYVFGGIDNTGSIPEILEIDTFHPQIIQLSGSLPAKLGLSSAVYDENSGMIYVLGGMDAVTEAVSNDIIEFSPLEGEAIKKIEKMSCPRAGGTALYTGTDKGILIFSGYGPTRGQYPDNIENYYPSNYISSGCYISTVKNLGAQAILGEISWTEDAPQGTDITMHIRHDPSEEWSCPYTVFSGEKIVPSKAQFIQIKAVFTTTDPEYTPVLADYSISYNCSPSKPCENFLDPGTSSNWACNPEFSWVFQDNDDDLQSAFQIQLRESTGFYGDDSSKDSQIIDNSQTSWEPEGWDLLHNESYCWRVRVKDDSDFENSWSDWSDDALFSVDKSSPEGIVDTPSDGGDITYMTEISFRWQNKDSKDPESGIAGYYLQITTSPSKSSWYKYDGFVMKNTEFTVYNCSDRTTYYARVRTVNGAGLFSEWSNWSNGIEVWSDMPVIPDDIDISLQSGDTGLGENDTINITGTSEPGTECRIMFKDQKGRILSEGIELYNTKTGTDGKINAAINIDNISDKYPTATEVQVEVSIIDPCGRVSEVSQASYKIKSDGYEVKLFDNVINPLETEKPVSIKINLKESQKVSIRIYDKEGSLVKRITENNHFDEGIHIFEWWGERDNGSYTVSGLYFVQIKTDRFSRNLKALVLK